MSKNTAKASEPIYDSRNSDEPGDSQGEANESKEQEQGDYQHIQEFVDGLDTDELAYLKGCLKNHKAESDVKDKEVSSGDFED